MYLSTKLITIIFTVSIVFINAIVMAEDEPFNQNSLSFSGFGTLAATRAGNDTLGYFPEFSQPYQAKDWSLKTNSLLGTQLNWNITPSFDANLQLIVKDRAKNGLAESIEWANLRYDIDDNIVVRAGRIGADIHMLSEYRNVSYAYLWLRPVVEFYKPVIFSHFDGIDIAYSKSLNEGLLKFKLFAGKTSVNLSYGDEYKTMDLADMLGLSILFENQKWKFRASTATAIVDDVDDPIPIILRSVLNMTTTADWADINTINDKLKYKDTRITYYSAGISYESDWQIQSEVSYLDSEWEYFPSSYSAYISIAKRLDNLTPYVVLSGIKMKEDAYQVGAPSAVWLKSIDIQRIIQQIFNQTQADQLTLSLGFRWDFRPNMALKAQWDHSKINDNKTAFWHTYDYPRGESSMDTFSISMDFIY